nr:structural protein [Tolivirales sp.]
MSPNGRNMRVTHCERFATVSPTAGTFEISKFSVNPGLANVFPWCCDVANRFDKYKFRSLSFRYVPQASAAAGTVCLAFDFDPNDPAPASMAEATTFHDYVMTSIWQEATMKPDLPNGDQLPQKNTRPGVPGVEFDMINYDVGNLYLITEGAAAGVIGYLEVTYVLDLFVHQVQSGVGGAADATADLGNGALFGTNFTPSNGSNLPGVATDAATFTFTQPFAGLVAVHLVGTTIAGVIVQIGTAVVTPLYAVTDAAQENTTTVFAVQASTGQTLSYTCMAAAHASAEHFFAPASYAALCG